MIYIRSVIAIIFIGGNLLASMAYKGEVLKHIFHDRRDGTINAKIFWPANIVHCAEYPLSGRTPNRVVMNIPHIMRPNRTRINWHISMNLFISVKFLTPENEVASEIFLSDYRIFCQFLTCASEKYSSFKKQISSVCNT